MFHSRRHGRSQTLAGLRTSLLAIALAGAAFTLHDSPARAQPASAIGQPLPKSDLPVGTLTVRVVKGERTSAVSGVDVTLSIVGGSTQVARTDAAGRATFAGLAPGTRVIATTAGESGDTSSVEFPIPEQGGVAVMLTTVPWKDDMGGGGAGAAAAGPMAGGRPSPRMMAGQARGEDGDPPGQVTVRLSYDDVDSQDGLARRAVVMVAYGSDDGVAAKVVTSDGGGRAVFEGLDTTGSTAYYALALLPRDGADDRLMSTTIVPIPEVGLRLFLSGEKIGSNKPPVEDLGKIAPQAALPAGQVLVAFGGAPQDGAVIELFDIMTKKVVATGSMRPARPVPSTITAEIGDAKANDKLAAGTVRVEALFVAGSRSAPLDGIKVTVRTMAALEPAPAPAPAPGPAPAPAPPPEAAPAPVPLFEQTATTDATGVIDLTGAPVGVLLEAVFDVQGKTFTSKPFQLEAARGATLPVSAGWQVLGMYETVFDGVRADRSGAYLVQATMHEQLYRSPPFQVTEGRGVVVPVYVLPKIAVTFQFDAHVDDAYLAVSGSITVQNFSFAPHAGPAEGVKIPMPAAATGLRVAEEDESWVSADAHEFRLLRPVPPFGGQFRAAFSLPISDGATQWDMPLPFGAYQSSIAILQTPGMQVIGLPPDVSARTVPQPNGMKWFAIQGITITPGKRMVFGVTGMPERPAWEQIAKRIAGVAALLLIGLGLWFALRRPSPTTAVGAAAGATAAAGAKKKRKKRIDDLLEQLTGLDRTQAGRTDGRREAVVTELEGLYREDAEPVEPRS